MSELINRLSDRLDSDIHRGVPFHIGMKHFTQFVKEAIKEIDRKVAYIEKLSKKK